jgi:hypothetical protein
LGSDAATLLRYRRASAGWVQSMVFFFPRDASGGKPLVHPGEKRVDFFWGIGPSSIQAPFNPRRMVARQNQDS